jgi:serine/threonine protein kinase
LISFFLFFLKVNVIGNLGTGGQGSVYSVTDPNIKEKYAIKRIPTQEAGGGVMREMEILLNENLHHINLVRYFNFFIDGGFAYIIMELCEEGNVEDYFKKYKTIPEEVFFFFYYFLCYFFFIFAYNFILK